MTITEIKKYLPNVTVKLPNKAFVVGKVTGRKNRFATVTFSNHEIETSIEVPWRTIQRVRTNTHWIIF